MFSPEIEVAMRLGRHHTDMDAVFQLPDIITHNYDPNGAFLHNLCDLPDAEAEEILDRFRATGSRLKPDYLQRRHAAEDWLIRERIAKLGSTRLKRPIYFFLGNFADGRDRSRPRSLLMPLSAFPTAVLTFTYPDSIASLPLATLPRHVGRKAEYHGRVFTLSEIREVIAKFGMPGEQWKMESSRLYDKFIEVQVWDDRPIRSFMKRGRQ